MAERLTACPNLRACLVNSKTLLWATNIQASQDCGSADETISWEEPCICLNSSRPWRIVQMGRPELRQKSALFQVFSSILLTLKEGHDCTLLFTDRIPTYLRFIVPSCEAT